MVFFFFNDTATTEIYTLSLHDALPISRGRGAAADVEGRAGQVLWQQAHRDRRAFRRDEGADRRLLAVAGEVDGRGDQMGQALPEPLPWRVRDRDSPGVRGGRLRGRIHARAQGTRGAPARAIRAAEENREEVGGIQ